MQEALVLILKVNKKRSLVYLSLHLGDYCDDISTYPYVCAKVQLQCIWSEVADYVLGFLYLDINYFVPFNIAAFNCT